MSNNLASNNEFSFPYEDSSDITLVGARWHHERYDGNGYPDGLSGTDIPEEARIISVADAYDAMSSSRCYNENFTQEYIIKELAAGKESQFDPVFTDIMLSIVNDGKTYSNQ